MSSIMESEMRLKNERAADGVDQKQPEVFTCKYWMSVIPELTKLCNDT